MMTTLFNKIFNSLYSFLPWNLNYHKRLRDDSSDENEENDNVGATPPKKARLHIAPYGHKILKEMNMPTVTTVKSNFKTAVTKLQITEDFYLPRRKIATKSPGPYRSLNYMGDCGRPPKHVSSPLKFRKRLTASTPIQSIDLTKNESSTSCEECKTVSTIDLTNTVSRSRSGHRSLTAAKSLTSVVDLTVDDTSPMKARKSTLSGRANGLNRRKSLEQMGKSKGKPVVSIDLTSSGFPRSSGIKKQGRSATSSSSSIEFIDLEERNCYGRVLGSMLEGKMPPTSSMKPLIKAGTLVDLTSDDEEMPKKSIPPQNNGGEPSIKYVTTSPVLEIKDDETSKTSFPAKNGMKLEIPRVNSFETMLKDVPCTHQEWVINLMKEYNETQKSFMETRDRFFREANAWSDENRRAVEELLEKKLERHLKITEALITETPEDEYPPIILPMSPFPKAVEDKINAALVRSPENEVLIDKFNLRITRRDIQTLNGLNWLNDEVINFYMQLLEERARTNEKFPSIHTFSTFFYAGLQSRGHAGMKRWTKKVNIFEKQMVIIPIHLRMHWCLVVIDLRKKELNYYDSMGHDNNECLKHMSNYLMAEHVAKQGSPLDMSDWKVQNIKNIPQQMNGSDCGIFACTYAEYSSRRAPFNFDQSRMQYYRRKMVYEIITGKLM